MKKARKTPKVPLAKPARPAWRAHALALAGLWALTLIAYSNSFQSDLIYDSDAAILQDPRVSSATLENVKALLTQDYWNSNRSNGLYRPLTKLSYLFNYAVLGSGPQPASYHWVNFALHAANIALVYLLGLLVFESAPAAVALAALWGVHPILTESITNVVGRADLLSALGVLAGLLCHVKASSAVGRRKAGWLAGLAAAATVGIFSKENAVVLVAAMAIYDLAYPRGASWRARLPGYGALAAPFAAFFWLHHAALSRLFERGFGFLQNPMVVADFWTARLTAFKALGKSLWLLLWPAHLSPDYSYNQIPLSTWNLHGLEDWKALSSLAAYAAAAAFAVLCYRRRKAVFFFIAFFLAAMAPTSNVFVLIGTIMAERFLYLPSIGFAGCLVAAIFAAGERFRMRGPRARLAVAAAVAAICLAFAVRTYVRNRDWRDVTSLWTSAVAACPNSFNTHYNLAVAWIIANSQDSAAIQREFDRAFAIIDPLPDVRNGASAYGTAGSWSRGRGDMFPAASTGWYQQALAYLLRARRIDAALAAEAHRANLRRGVALSAYSSWPPLYLELGRVYLRLGQPRQALEALEFGRSAGGAPPAFDYEIANARNALGY